MKEYLPPFLHTYYEKLLLELDVAKKSDIINTLFFKSLSFFGKLYLLEYSSSMKQHEKINYWLFSCFDENNVNSWILLIDKMNNFLQHNALILPLDKICNLMQEENYKVTIIRLLWFSEVSGYQKNLESETDINESQDHLLFFLSLFKFLKDVKCEVKNDKTYFTTNSKSLPLNPFFIAKLEGSDGLYIKEECKFIKIFSEKKLTLSYQQYRMEKKGLITFSKKINNSIMPWIDAKLDNVLAEIFTLPIDMQARKIKIEGAPATGKTTLCHHLLETGTNYCDAIIAYFVKPESVYQDSATFKLWFYRNLKELFGITENIIKIKDQHIDIAPGLQKLHEALKAEKQKIICCIDGIDYMPINEYNRLRQFIEDDIFNSIVFIVFKRRYALHDVDNTYAVSLMPEDNIAFEDAFTSSYIQTLLSRYVNDDIGRKIFTHVIKNYTEQTFSIKKISEELEIYTPKVLKCIQKMKPLLLVQQIGKSFCLFDKITTKFPQEL